MAHMLTFNFAKKVDNATNLAVVLLSSDAPTALPKALGDTQSIDKAIAVEEFSGKKAKSLAIVAPHGAAFDRVTLMGVGDAATLEAKDWIHLGGSMMGAIGAAESVTVLTGDLALSNATIEALILGMQLRNYKFDKYQTKSDDDEPKAKNIQITIIADDVKGAEVAAKEAMAVADGVILARDCVNEPANILGPQEFADKAKALESLGIKTRLLDKDAMEKLGMHALLGVNQGSVRPAYLAIMEWDGGKKGEAPLAFIGKGVVFDTGGISIKPSGGMEDMKGDMGGAAAVIGLMHTLAARKAKANVVGILGLVENMPDGNAQRPGDIVTSMSGQTIEIINTDAEGRLVLADALWYCNETFKPKFMINLATLTGAVLVALGNHHAGLFSNNDELSEQISTAGHHTGELVWRLPLAKEYDKLIDSKFADMKNTGGRYAGSITAAQFLQRFVKDTPWVHLDIAGTAMGSPQTDINKSWGSGFGVRLLDQLVRDLES